MDRTGDKVSRPGPQFPERPTQDGSRPSQPNADSQQDGGTLPPTPNGSRPTPTGGSNQPTSGTRPPPMADGK